MSPRRPALRRASTGLIGLDRLQRPGQGPPGSSNRGRNWEGEVGEGDENCGSVFAGKNGSLQGKKNVTELEKSRKRMRRFQIQFCSLQSFSRVHFSRFGRITSAFFDFPILDTRHLSGGAGSDMSNIHINRLK